MPASLPRFTLAAAGALLAASAFAQSFPAKPIRIIVPFPPGAFNDTLGRTIAAKFSDSGFGQAVVDNRPGAGSTIGADLAAKSPADGHTLLIVAFPLQSSVPPEAPPAPS